MSVRRPPQELKARYRTASICGNNCGVFNLGGNKFRLVVGIQYRAGIV
jgi:mRNA interferase HigB